MFQDVFRVFLVILWIWFSLNEIARPGGLAGRFRSHGDRNWNSRGRSSCDCCDSVKRKGYKKRSKFGRDRAFSVDAMKPGEKILENCTYISLLNGFVVNMSRFKEHVSWQTIFFQVKSMFLFRLRAWANTPSSCPIRPWIRPRCSKYLFLGWPNQESWDGWDFCQRDQISHMLLMPRTMKHDATYMKLRHRKLYCRLLCDVLYVMLHVLFPMFY